MALSARPNDSGAVHRGKPRWIWRNFVTRLTAGSDILFSLEKNIILLDFVYMVVAPATGTSSTGTLRIKNTAGDVDVSTAQDLKATAGSTQTLNRLASGAVSSVVNMGKVTDKAKCDIELVVAATAITVGATVRIGLCVSRLDLNP